MRLLVVPDSFKGCMTSAEVAEIIGAAAEHCAAAHCVYLPIADGGEGSVDCLLAALGGEKHTLTVKSPEWKPISADYGISSQGTALIEIAQSSGITRQTSYRTGAATTYGFGQLIADALDRGCRDFLLCLGGSATTDGGCGFAAALGAAFYNRSGEAYVPVGATLSELEKVDLSGMDPRIAQSRFTVMSDVENPLTGPNGAAAVFGPQKGATAEEVPVLDAGLARLARVLAQATGKNAAQFPGAGAAGGAGYGCMVFLNAVLRSGIDTLLDMTDFDRKVAECDLIATGEGKLDSQSLMGKVLSGILKRAEGKPVVTFCGASELSATVPGLDIVEIGRGLPLAEAVAKGPALLKSKAEAFFTAKYKNN